VDHIFLHKKSKQNTTSITINEAETIAHDLQLSVLITRHDEVLRELSPPSISSQPNLPLTNHEDRRVRSRSACSDDWLAIQCVDLMLCGGKLHEEIVNLLLSFVAVPVPNNCRCGHVKRFQSVSLTIVCVVVDSRYLTCKVSCLVLKHVECCQLRWCAYHVEVLEKRSCFLKKCDAKVCVQVRVRDAVLLVQVVPVVVVLVLLDSLVNRCTKCD